MSERGTELMMRASRQWAEMTEFFATLSEADLVRPCAGADAGDTVGAVAAHAAEGYHRLGRLLLSTGHVLAAPPASGTSRPGPSTDHVTLPGLRARLAGGETSIRLLSGLTGEQLKGPAPPVPHVSTDPRTLEGLIEDVIDHQAAHLATLRRAIAAEA
ncbi:hypothetical protein [Streptomyces sp. H27-S2]|uniref:hypothetical protein n=1 Tax=Streptomyces antarcticus TaxID=2996458 RepID=UPI0022719B4A|nr:hypothetical protein [Streptomyces sp. H27-S2]MCY0955161.1 hypothetical protein [Streptomyces sp. H27-S2]